MTDILTFLQDGAFLKSAECAYESFMCNGNGNKKNSENDIFSIKRYEDYIELTENSFTSTSPVRQFQDKITIRDGLFVYDEERKELIITQVLPDSKCIQIFMIKNFTVEKA